MSTYRIYHENKETGVSEPFDLVGVFHKEEDAHAAAEILADKFGGTFDVVRSKRGRPAGSKDTVPRKRRTKAEIMLKVLGHEESAQDDLGGEEEPMPSTVDAMGETAAEASDLDNENDDDYTPDSKEFNQMMQDIEADRAAHNDSPDSATGF